MTNKALINVIITFGYLTFSLIYEFKDPILFSKGNISINIVLQCNYTVLSDKDLQVIFYIKTESLNERTSKRKSVVFQFINDYFKF